MKKFNKIWLLLFAPVLFYTACSDMLEVDSDRIITGDENKMKSDSLYSMLGVFSQLQKLADSYVILGELRGEMLEPDERASRYLKEIYNFGSYSDDNPYTTNQKDYYAVINNCNYVIHNIDTTKTLKGEKTMYKVMAAAKGIRAWTYMQLVLNFGEAYYYDNPIKNVNEALSDFPRVTLNELAPLLIEDLLPYQGTDFPRLGSFAGFSNSQILYFPISFLLGDLYLWSGQYTQAAEAYYDLIYKNFYTVNSTYQNSWRVEGSGSSKVITDERDRWTLVDIFNGKSRNEYITAIAVSNEYEKNFVADSLLYQLSFSSYDFIDPILKPTEVAITKFDSAVYFEDYYISGGELYTVSKLGDLRKNATYEIQDIRVNPNDPISELAYVFKYTNMNIAAYSSGTGNDRRDTEAKMVLPYRISLLYLRYAEAINRCGKPNTAMAVMKNGLNSETLADRTIIPAKEVNPLPGYMDFTNTNFDANIGTRSHGLGPNAGKDTTIFIIRTEDIENPTLQDSILYVEKLLLDELALEMAYEGQRFTDLMRFAIRRNEESLLANIVASKFESVSEREQIRQKLLDRSNWYVK